MARSPVLPTTLKLLINKRETTFQENKPIQSYFEISLTLFLLNISFNFVNTFMENEEWR